MNQTDQRILGPGMMQQSRRDGIFIQGTAGVSSRVTVKQVTVHHNCFNRIRGNLLSDSIFEGNTLAALTTLGWLATFISVLPALRSLCDNVDMSETLTIRLPAEEKKRWERAAAAVKESVADYVRKAVRQRTETSRGSPWEEHLGVVPAKVPPPTNANIRAAFAKQRKVKR
jgi:hypothetical protein